jgi:hypothetical protein
MTDEEMDAFRRNNARYREVYQFPFILAVRNATKQTELAALAGRAESGAPYERELSVALEQVHKIAWMRLLAALDLAACRGFLTCHVLDTASGCPGKPKQGPRLSDVTRSGVGVLRKPIAISTIVSFLFRRDIHFFLLAPSRVPQPAACASSSTGCPRPRGRAWWEST